MEPLQGSIGRKVTYISQIAERFHQCWYKKTSRCQEPQSGSADDIYRGAIPSMLVLEDVKMSGTTEWFNLKLCQIYRWLVIGK